MGLGKRKPRLDEELFRATEPAEERAHSAPDRATAAPAVEAKAQAAPVEKDRLSLYLPKALAKRFRLYCVEKERKNANALITELIEEFLTKEGFWP